MTTKQHSHLVLLMAEYYSRVDKIHNLRAEAAELKERILKACDPGKYGKYSVSRVKKQLIHVNAYTRSAYSIIRRSK